jgi:tRNA (mo5U34)-methyltransferase
VTPEEIQGGIERLGPWFQCLELPGGVRTKTASIAGEALDNPARQWEVVGECLPGDLTGRSVLDVGCNAGFFAVEAKRRGAARVLGVDSQRQAVRQARFARDALGLDIEYRRRSIYDFGPADGAFDVVLALGLVYHCKHLVLALERLFAVTRELLIVESAVVPRGALPASIVQPLASRDCVLHPLAYVANPPDSWESVANWFVPTPEALAALLRGAGFPGVEIVAVRGDRAFLVCRRPGEPPDSRRIGHLGASVEVERAPAAAPRGSTVTFHVRAVNTGVATWLRDGDPRTGAGAVRIAAHLMRGEDEVVWDWARVPIPRDLRWGESASLELRAPAPAEPGRYTVEFDVVSERVAFLENLGSQPATHDLVVG